MSANIGRYVREDISNIGEFAQIYNSLNEEFDLLYNAIDNVLLNTFIDDLDENGCTRYEKMLGLTKKVSDTTEDRRLRILTFINGDRPYTITALKEKLEEICGADKVYISMDFTAHTIRILIDLASQNSLKAVNDMVKKILPCNLYLNVDLNYNTHSVLGNYTHAELGNYTHLQLRSDVLGE